MGRRKDKILEAEQEISGGVATIETPKVGEISISKEAPVGSKGANEFGDEYTMEVIADNEPGADNFRIPNKDPKFEYRFLRDDKTNMNIKTSNLLYSKGGWQICPTSHLIKIGIKKENFQPDGSYKVGELVLAFMPKVLFDKKMKKDRENAKAATDGVQTILEGKSRVNVQGVHGISKGKVERKGPLDFGTHNSVEE